MTQSQEKKSFFYAKSKKQAQKLAYMENFSYFCTRITEKQFKTPYTMKKFFAVLLIGILSMSAMAQSPVYRIGDKYMMDGKMMNKREFKGYLQNTCPEAFQLFNNGYKLSIAGWVCLSTGVVANSVGSTMLRMYLRSNISDRKQYMYDVGYTLTSIGSSAAVAGIVCLSVGYSRMHKSVHLYNLEKANRPDIRLVFGLNQTGDVTMAMQF